MNFGSGNQQFFQHPNNIMQQQLQPPIPMTMRMQAPLTNFGQSMMSINSAPAVRPPPPPGPPPADPEQQKIVMLQNQAKMWQQQREAAEVEERRQKQQEEQLLRNLAQTNADVRQWLDEERQFEEQYNTWKKQFNDWKEQNKDHPDKEQYKQYELQWKQYEIQMDSQKEELAKRRQAIIDQHKMMPSQQNRNQPSNFPHPQGVGQQINQPGTIQNNPGAVQNNPGNFQNNSGGFQNNQGGFQNSAVPTQNNSGFQNNPGAIQVNSGGFQSNPGRFQNPEGFDHQMQQPRPQGMQMNQQRMHGHRAPNPMSQDIRPSANMMNNNMSNQNRGFPNNMSRTGGPQQRPLLHENQTQLSYSQGQGSQFQGQGPQNNMSRPQFRGQAAQHEDQRPRFGGQGQGNQFGGQGFHSGVQSPPFRNQGPQFRGQGPHSGFQDTQFRGQGPQHRGPEPQYRNQLPQHRPQEPQHRGQGPQNIAQRPQCRGPRPQFHGPGSQNLDQVPQIGNPNFQQRGLAPQMRGQAPRPTQPSQGQGQHGGNESNLHMSRGTSQSQPHNLASSGQDKHGNQSMNASQCGNQPMNAIQRGNQPINASQQAFSSPAVNNDVKIVQDFTVDEFDDDEFYDHKDQAALAKPSSGNTYKQTDEGVIGNRKPLIESIPTGNGGGKPDGVGEETSESSSNKGMQSEPSLQSAPNSSDSSVHKSQTPESRQPIRPLLPNLGSRNPLQRGPRQQGPGYRQSAPGQRHQGSGYRQSGPQSRHPGPHLRSQTPMHNQEKPATSTPISRPGYPETNRPPDPWQATSQPRKQLLPNPWDPSSDFHSLAPDKLNESSSSRQSWHDGTHEKILEAAKNMSQEAHAIIRRAAHDLNVAKPHQEETAADGSTPDHQGSYGEDHRTQHPAVRGKRHLTEDGAGNGNRYSADEGYNRIRPSDVRDFLHDRSYPTERDFPPERDLPVDRDYPPERGYRDGDAFPDRWNDRPYGGKSYEPDSRDRVWPSELHPSRNRLKEDWDYDRRLPPPRPPYWDDDVFDRDLHRPRRLLPPPLLDTPFEHRGDDYRPRDRFYDDPLYRDAYPELIRRPLHEDLELFHPRLPPRRPEFDEIYENPYLRPAREPLPYETSARPVEVIDYSHRQTRSADLAASYRDYRMKADGVNRERDRSPIHRAHSPHSQSQSARPHVSDLFDAYSAMSVPQVTDIQQLLCKPHRDKRPAHICLIVRGPPGAGKTYVSKLIRDKESANGGSAPRILNLDDYFMVEVERLVTDDDTGKKIKRKMLEYEYEPEMEESYRLDFYKSFKKTIEKGYFSFIIVDAVNDKVVHFEEFAKFAKSKGFQVYIADIQGDAQTCFSRNTHNRSLKDIEHIIAGWERTPSYFNTIDLRGLLQDDAISDVDMEDKKQSDSSSSDSDNDGDDDLIQVAQKSKWEVDNDDQKLKKLDGLLHKKIDSVKNMEDFLSLTDDYETRFEDGKKHVRWADLEEKRLQKRDREMGFVVGHTNWNRMLDDDYADKQLNKLNIFNK